MESLKNLLDLRQAAGEGKITRSPIELSLCLIRWLPGNAWTILESKHNNIKRTPLIDEWWIVQEQKYVYIGDWLAHWAFDMSKPQGELASMYSPIATSIHVFINDFSYALYELSPALRRQFPGAGGRSKMYCLALYSDFFAQMADDGIGHSLGLQGYPQPLIEGKDARYERSIAEQRLLGSPRGNRSKPKRGRPKKLAVRRYPESCLFYHRLMLEAKQVAESNSSFRNGPYKKYLKARSEEMTFVQSLKKFQVGVVVKDQGLVLSEKGKKFTAVEVAKKAIIFS